MGQHRLHTSLPAHSDAGWPVWNWEVTGPQQAMCPAGVSLSQKVTLNKSAKFMNLNVALFLPWSDFGCDSSIIHLPMHMSLKWPGFIMVFVQVKKKFNGYYRLWVDPFKIIITISYNLRLVSYLVALYANQINRLLHSHCISKLNW